MARVVATLVCCGALACGVQQETADSSAEVPDTAVVASTAEASVDKVEQPPADRRIEFESYTEIFELFERLNYTPEAWQAGIRQVPRVFVARVGERWRSKTTKEIDVRMKKRLFFRALAPLVLRANEMILADRERASRLIFERRAGRPGTPDDERWLLELARRCDVVDVADPRTGRLEPRLR